MICRMIQRLQSWLKKRTSPRIYLDHAAATPLCAAAYAAMEPLLVASYGNPSAIHAEGRAARLVVEEARQQVARTLGVRPGGVTFVSGGTEANAVAIVGHLTARVRAGAAWSELEVVSTPLEHPSVREALTYLETLGVTVRLVAVDEVGIVTPAALRAVLSERTVLVTCAYVNSEIGTIQPVAQLVRTVRAFSREHGTARVVVHLDAAQAPLWLGCELPRLGIDVISLDGGKCGGPKGSGAVIVHGAVPLAPVWWGGGQEQGLRPGTENVAGIAGFAAALSWAQAGVTARTARVTALRDQGIVDLCAALPGAVLNGPRGEQRVANNINISIPGLDTEYAVVALDVAGIAASTKSACAGAGGGESAVVQAITGDAARARSTLRLTLGPDSSAAHITAAARTLADHVALMGTLTQ